MTHPLEEDLDLNLCGKKGSSHLTEEKLNAYQDEMSGSLPQQQPPASQLEKGAKKQEL